MKIKQLQEIVGESWVITEKERMLDYLTDETATKSKPLPAADLVLIKPASSEEVSLILKLANQEGVPVFPRGGGTGLSGGAIPTENGIILSLERINKIEVDHDNLMVVAGAGVTLKDLTQKVEQEGLFFPPHPGDDSSQMGGLVSCNAGGSRAVKYGVIRNYVKGVDAVLATGEVLRLGGKLLKNNTGYDLMHLIIGSEGTLAVITKIILRLFPQMGGSATMVIPFNDRHNAIDCVPKILQSGVMPMAIEYMERDSIELSAKHLNLEWPCKTGTAFLMIIVDGRGEDEVYSDCVKISNICERYNGLEPIIGKTRKEQERILKIRSNMYLAMKHKLADSLDAAVPPAEMGTFMDAIDRIAARFSTSIPMHGHAGDGNLHPHLLKDLEKAGAQNLKEVKREVYREALKLGGVITAEHGLGKIRLADLDDFLGQKEMELMRGIKQVFDPKGILNPGCAIRE